MLVITGAGRAFCAGQDLADPDMAMGAKAPDIGNVVEQNYKPLILRRKETKVRRLHPKSSPIQTRTRYQDGVEISRTTVSL